jgi:hypothetical protein
MGQVSVPAGVSLISYAVSALTGPAKTEAQKCAELEAAYNRAYEAAMLVLKRHGQGPEFVEASRVQNEAWSRFKPCKDRIRELLRQHEIAMGRAEDRTAAIRACQARGGIWVDTKSECVTRESTDLGPPPQLYTTEIRPDTEEERRELARIMARADLSEAERQRMIAHQRRSRTASPALPSVVLRPGISPTAKTVLGVLGAAALVGLAVGLVRGRR